MGMQYAGKDAGMRDEYDFNDAKANPYAVTVDGSGSRRPAPGASSVHTVVPISVHTDRDAS